MSVLKISFDMCIARPDEGERVYPLREHLIGVGKFLRDWAQLHPVIGKDETWLRLAELSGCCHDIVKANWRWQHYIRHADMLGSPMPHAPAGASLFSYLAYHLLNARGVWPDYYMHWYRMTRDIADHHGALKALDQDSWRKAADWDNMDLRGVAAFIYQQFAELASVPITRQAMDAWVLEVDDVIRKAGIRRMMLERRKPSLTWRQAMDDLHVWRYMTTGLIAADRFDISPVTSSELGEAALIAANKNIAEYCNSNSNRPLATERTKAQADILRQLRELPDALLYTLSMPTGYGKTVTAFMIALWLAEHRGCNKIVYVAPYIAILEQTSDVFEKAMGLRAMEHHSLAIWDEREYKAQLHGDASHLLSGEDDKGEQRTPDNQLIVEAWAHEVVCTSFQQLGRAVFPRRAQDVLRRAFLRNSVLLIDEPQVFNPEGWNTLLCGLESLAEQYNMRIVFMSATMPPFQYSGITAPAALSYAPAKSAAQQAASRYCVCVKPDAMDERSLARHIVDRPEPLKGAILNTIQDACLVYKEVSEQPLDSSVDIRLIHGLMIPLHKKTVIARIQQHLKHRRDHPLIVISTQVLEAGVDVSLMHVARALAVLPSIVQAAGRVNRHGELPDPGELTLFSFLRGGKVNTRKTIYDSGLTRITDELLSRQPVWSEQEMAELIQEYYQRMFQINNYTSPMEAIVQAHQGQWPKLSSFDPFGSDLFRLPLFVPWRYTEEDEQYLPDVYVQLRDRFRMQDPEEIYECYMNKRYWRKRDFAERKAFTVLFHHYILNIPVKPAYNLIGSADYLEHRIPYFRSNAYDAITGLTQKLDADFDPII